jgi:hypothetical protein
MLTEYPASATKELFLIIELLPPLSFIALDEAFPAIIFTELKTISIKSLKVMYNPMFVEDPLVMDIKLLDIKA